MIPRLRKSKIGTLRSQSTSPFPNYFFFWSFISHSHRSTLTDATLINPLLHISARCWILGYRWTGLHWSSRQVAEALATMYMRSFWVLFCFFGAWLSLSLRPRPLSYSCNMIDIPHYQIPGQFHCRTHYAYSTSSLRLHFLPWRSLTGRLYSVSSLSFFCFQRKLPCTRWWFILCTEIHGFNISSGTFCKGIPAIHIKTSTKRIFYWLSNSKKRINKVVEILSSSDPFEEHYIKQRGRHWTY